jgi:hypothetical protein
MDFLMSKIGDYVFLIRSAGNQSIPKASPRSLSDVAMQIQEDFKVNASGVKLFWPDDEEATVMIGVLPSGLV